MNVNVPMVAQGMGIVRLVRSTIGKTAPVQIAGKQGMKVKRNRTVWFDHTRIARFVEILSQVDFVNVGKNSLIVAK